MRTMEMVDIDDVYPVVDEYGNFYLSRDYSTKENIAYVEELAASMAEKGEPDEPPILVRDGGIFRIKCGNTRVLAMRKLGTKRFQAVIDEDATPQSLVEATVRTNTKKKYAKTELSRFIQQLSLFDAGQYVAKTSGLKQKDAERFVKGARFARAIGDDIADNLTLDHGMWIGEFEGDPEAQKELSLCSAKDIKKTYARLKQDRAIRKAMMQIGLKLKELGVSFVKECPEGYGFGKYIHWNSPESLEDLGEFCAAKPADGGFFIYTRAPKGFESSSPEIEAKRQRKARMHEVKQARREFFNETWPKLPNFTARAVEEFGFIGVYEQTIAFYIMDYELLKSPAPSLCAIRFFVEAHESPFSFDGWFTPASAKLFCEFTDLLVLDGYIPPQEEWALYEEAKGVEND